VRLGWADRNFVALCKKAKLRARFRSASYFSKNRIREEIICILLL
jgi:hypothetical protein